MATASLPDGLVEEILLRLPPADPVCLARASAVCKPWRSLIRGDAFLDRYRAFHRTPPLQGFFHNQEAQLVARWGPPGDPDPDHLPLFVSTTAPCAPQPMPLNWYTIDSRHGRVLFFTSLTDRLDAFKDPDDWDLVVWDPAGGGQWELFFPCFIDGMDWDGTVLCAADGCDHLDCHGGHFLVAFVVTGGDGITSACLYSSETDEWNKAEVASLANPNACRPNTETKPTVLLGGMLYFLCFSSKILKYDMGGQELAVIELPLVFESGAVLMVAEGGGLGFASVQGSSIKLWSMEEDANGVGQWTQRRVIELEAMFPIGVFSAVPAPELIGLAEGVGILFVRTNLGIFTIELKSGRIKKVSSDGSITNAIP